ncbi:MAG: hypothetical protein KF833_11130 [Verrucomicrobiae bacterium]|nr:hypothetical protein [Verrucomicrobiae bacterium]
MNPSREEALFALALEKLAEKRAAFLDAIRLLEDLIEKQRQVLGRQAAYESNRDAMPARFGSTTNAQTANRVAKMCLLQPLYAGQRMPAVELADHGVRLGENSQSLRWCLFAQSLARYVLIAHMPLREAGALIPGDIDERKP